VTPEFPGARLAESPPRLDQHRDVVLDTLLLGLPPRRLFEESLHVSAGPNDSNDLDRVLAEPVDDQAVLDRETAETRPEVLSAPAEPRKGNQWREAIRQGIDELVCGSEIVLAMKSQISSKSFVARRETLTFKVTRPSFSPAKPVFRVLWS
jgi:hypothetical protein